MAIGSSNLLYCKVSSNLITPLVSLPRTTHHISPQIYIYASYATAAKGKAAPAGKAAAPAKKEAPKKVAVLKPKKKKRPIKVPVTAKLRNLNKTEVLQQKIDDLKNFISKRLDPRPDMGWVRILLDQSKMSEQQREELFNLVRAPPYYSRKLKKEEIKGMTIEEEAELKKKVQECEKMEGDAGKATYKEGEFPAEQGGGTAFWRKYTIHPLDVFENANEYVMGLVDKTEAEFEAVRREKRRIVVRETGQLLVHKNGKPVTTNALVGRARGFINRPFIYRKMLTWYASRKKWDKMMQIIQEMQTPRSPYTVQIAPDAREDMTSAEKLREYHWKRTRPLHKPDYGTLNRERHDLDVNPRRKDFHDYDPNWYSRKRHWGIPGEVPRELREGCAIALRQLLEHAPERVEQMLDFMRKIDYPFDRIFHGIYFEYFTTTGQEDKILPYFENLIKYGGVVSETALTRIITFYLKRGKSLDSEELTRYFTYLDAIQPIEAYTLTPHLLPFIVEGYFAKTLPEGLLEKFKLYMGNMEGPFIKIGKKIMRKRDKERLASMLELMEELAMEPKFVKFVTHETKIKKKAGAPA